MNNFFQEVYKQYNSICQDALIKSKDLRVPFNEFLEILHKHEIKAEENPQCSFLLKNAKLKEGDLIDTKLFLNCVVKTVSKETYSHDQFTIDLFWESKFQASQKHVDLDTFNKEFFDFFKVMLKREEIESILNDCFNYLLKKGKENMSKKVLKKVVQKSYSKVFDDIFQTHDQSEANKENQHLKSNQNGIETFPDSLDLRSTGQVILGEKNLDRMSHFQGTQQSGISEIVKENSVSVTNSSKPPFLNKKDPKNSTFNTAAFFQSSVKKRSYHQDPTQLKRFKEQSSKLIFFSLQRVEQKDRKLWLEEALNNLKQLMNNVDISSIQKGEQCVAAPQLNHDSGLGLKEIKPIIGTSSLVSEANISGIGSTKNQEPKGVFSFNHSIEDHQRAHQKQSLQTNTLTYSHNTNSNVNFLSLHQVQQQPSNQNSGQKTPQNPQKVLSSGISTYNNNQYPSDNQFPPSSWRQEKSRSRIPFQELKTQNQLLPTTQESSCSQLKINSAAQLENQLTYMRQSKRNFINPHHHHHQQQQSSNNDISQQTRRSQNQTCVINNGANTQIMDQSSLSEIQFQPHPVDHRQKKTMTQEFEHIPRSRRSSQAPTQYLRGSKTNSEFSQHFQEGTRRGKSMGKTRNRENKLPPYQLVDQSYLIDESNIDGPTQQTKSFLTSSTIPTQNLIPQQQKRRRSQQKRQSLEREQQMYILETPGQLQSSGLATTEQKKKRKIRTGCNNSSQRDYDSIRLDQKFNKRALSHSKDYYSKYKKLKHRYVSLSSEIVKHKERTEVEQHQLGSNFERIQNENIVLKNQLQTIKEQNLECTMQLQTDLKKKSLITLCLRKILSQNSTLAKSYFWWKQQVANQIQRQILKEKASRQVGKKKIFIIFQNWKHWAHKNRSTKVKRHNKKLQLKILKSVLMQKERKERVQAFNFWYQSVQRERENCFFQDLEMKDSQIRRLTVYISLAQITSSVQKGIQRQERDFFELLKVPQIEPPTLGHTMQANEFMSTGFQVPQQIISSMTSNQAGTISGQKTVKGQQQFQERELKFQSTGKINNYGNALSPTYAHHQTQQLNQATLGTLNSHAINPLISVGNGSYQGGVQKLMMTQGTRELSPTPDQYEDEESQNMGTLQRRDSIQNQPTQVRIQEQKYNTYDVQNSLVQSNQKYQNRSVGNSVAKKELITQSTNSRMSMFTGIEKLYALKKKQFQKLKRLALRQWNQKVNQTQSVHCENLATFAKQKTSHSHVNSCFSQTTHNNSSVMSQEPVPRSLQVHKLDASPCFKPQVIAGEFDLEETTLEPKNQEQVPQPVNQKQVGAFYRTDKGFFLVDLGDTLKKGQTITSQGSTMSEKDDPMPSFGRGRTKDQVAIFNQQCILGQRSASIGGQKHRYNNSSRLSANFVTNERPQHSVGLTYASQTPQRTAATSRYEPSSDQKQEMEMEKRSKSVGKQQQKKQNTVPKEDLQQAIDFLKAQVQL